MRKNKAMRWFRVWAFLLSILLMPGQQVFAQADQQGIPVQEQGIQENQENNDDSFRSNEINAGGEEENLPDSIESAPYESEDMDAADAEGAEIEVDDEFYIYFSDDGFIEIQPLNVNVKSTIISLNISSGKATVTVSVTGYTNVTSIQADVTLQRKSGSSWVTVKSFSNSESNFYALFSNSTTLSTKGEHRAAVAITAKSPSKTEKLSTKYSNTATY